MSTTRLCPLTPSKGVPVGHRKQGVDGRTWECKKISQGTRWVKVPSVEPTKATTKAHPQKKHRKSSEATQKRRGKPTRRKGTQQLQKPWWYNDDIYNPDGRAMREFEKWENTVSSATDDEIVTLSELMSEAAHWGPAVFFDVCMYMFDRGNSIMGKKFGALPTGIPWEQVTDEGTLRDIKLIGRVEMVIEKVREDHKAYPEDQ